MDRLIKNKKLEGEITAITSKSYAHRAIFAAGLCHKNSTIIIDDLSKDIEASLNAIKSLGVDVLRDKNKFHIYPPKKYKNPVVANVSESGTTLRFLIPVIATLGLDAKIIREKSLINRTNSVYKDLFKKQGIKFLEKDESIYLSGKFQDFNFDLPGDISSQFISGLMIASGTVKEDFNINVNTKIESKPYVDMTIDVLEKFGLLIFNDKNSYICKNTFKATDYIVEKDWSNALFFLGAGVEVKGLDKNSKQGDKNALKFLEKLGYINVSEKEIKIKKLKKPEQKLTLDAKNIPDAVPILCVISAHAPVHVEIINTRRLKLKESDRVKSTVEMLRNLGVEVDVRENSFSFDGIDKFNSAKINSYNDHRIAMAASIAATFADGPIKIIDSECVEKSYTNFYCDFKRLGGEIDVL